MVGGIFLRHLQIDGCLVEYIGNKTYRVRRDDATKGYALIPAGLTITFDFTINRSHILKRLELYSVDSSLDDSSNTKDVWLGRQKELLPAKYQKVYRNTINIDIETIATLGLNEGDYGPGNYRISCTGTNTDRLYWDLFVRVTD